MFKIELPNKDQGFTLIEVLVAIIIVTVFVTVTMQAMTIALYFKVRAREYSEAMFWIQQDLETQKQTAATYQYGKLISQTVNTITITTTPNVNIGDTIMIGSENVGSLGTSYTVIGAINSSSGTVLTLDQNVATTHIAGEIVAFTTKCGTVTTPATITTGFGIALEGQITGTTPANSNPISQNFTKTSSFSGKNFTMNRITTIVNSVPYNQLILQYQVIPQYNSTTIGSALATVQTQIIPNATLVCPAY